MGLKYRIQATIPYDMADINSNVRLPQLMALVMQVSGMQSVEVGMADDYILEKFGLGWIISEHTMTIKRLPRFLEEVTIETEAMSHNRYFCYRVFKVFDSDGENIFEMMTTFLLMDIKNRKAVPVLDEITEPFGSSFVKKIIRGPKYKELENPETTDYRVRFYDLDMNGHVNNGKYLEWVYESLGVEFLKKHVPIQVDIKYLKEVLPGGLVTTAVELEDLTSHHQIISEGEVSAVARIEWCQL
ncbi:acyl-ACP thioesterase domain-containing protein [Streptococcus massiliensis]|uniref:Acyl-ACP thioesterase n=1 Tax=Streptococcus massiliensis TaxID=313439 RepID=A0A380KXU6_9STRE|nr:acyl-ACP thioesterase domain-containing protein [Streptococcus massiliensis]SUN75766.1 acyl-ACP thioesterase [Streptococcus massiliensis]